MADDVLITDRVYVTRWGLTRGIVIYPNGGRIVDGRYFQGGSVARSCSDPAYCFVGPKDYTTDREVALSRVRAAAVKKLNALDRQRKKLEAVCNGGVNFSFAPENTDD